MSLRHAAMRRMRCRAGGGFTLLETLVAIVVLSIGLLGLAAAAGLAVRDMSRSRRDFSYWGDVQQVVDSLLGVGWNVVTNGSTTVRDRAMSWTVTTESANRQRLNITISRTRYDLTGSASDALVLYLAKPTPGS